MDRRIDRPAAHPALDVVEPAKQPSVAQVGEAGKIVSAHMDGLQERRRGHYKAPRPQHSGELGHASLRVTHVFQD